MGFRIILSLTLKLAIIYICIGMLRIDMLAYADGPALDVQFITGGQDLNNGTFSLGWNFTVNSQVTVSALGFYDDGKNGLTTSHEVGIYDAGCNLIANATVQPSDTLRGFFRYHDLATSVTLSPGQTYSIVAVTGGEAYLYNPNAVVLDSAVNFGKFTAWQAALQQTSSLQCPNFPSSTDFYGDFGPSFYIGTPSDGGSTKRATAITIFCNRSGDLLTAICTATVADQGAPPRKSPTGEVQFSATEGSLAGSSCTLQQVGFSPGISSCTMSYAPPAGFPIGKAFPVSAAYAGDSDFDSSSNSHKAIFASCVGTQAKPCPNSVGLGFGDIPAIVAKAISMIATCGAGEKTQAVHLGTVPEIAAGGRIIDQLGGGCNITAGLGVDLEKLVVEIPQEDLEKIYNAFASAQANDRKESLFEYSEAVSRLPGEIYKQIQANPALTKEIIQTLEKNTLNKDWSKALHRYNLAFALSAKSKSKAKTKEPLLVFSKLEKTVKANKSAVMKFKLNNRVQKLVNIFKNAGIPTLPIKVDMVVKQKKRTGKATLSQTADIVIK